MAWFTVKTYHKKNVEQREIFYRQEGEGEITVTDGFRWAEYRVETNDDDWPQFKFTNCPGGSDDLDSIDLNCCSGDNIESTELVEMFDGGCWGDIEFSDDIDEDEQEELREKINEEGSYSIEDDGEWYLSDTEVWAWGPFEVTNEDGETRLVIADADGNMVEFKEE
jgi:hypothetical protein